MYNSHEIQYNIMHRKEIYQQWIVMMWMIWYSCKVVINNNKKLNFEPRDMDVNYNHGYLQSTDLSVKITQSITLWDNRDYNLLN